MCHRVSPVLVSSASMLLRASPVKVTPESVVSTPALPVPALEFEGGFPRVSVLGTVVHAVNRGVARDVLARLVASRAGSQIVTVNIDFLAVSRRHDKFQIDYQQCGINRHGQESRWFGSLVTLESRTASASLDLT